MKEIVIDFRKRSGGHAPDYINGNEVEMVKSFRLLGIQITNNLPWSLPTPSLSQEAKGICHVCYGSHQLLCMHRRKHSFWWNHSLVWLLLCPRPQETTNGHKRSPVHNTNQPSINWLCLKLPLPWQSCQHNQGSHTPRTYSLPPSSIGKKIQKSEVT